MKLAAAVLPLAGCDKLLGLDPIRADAIIATSTTDVIHARSRTMPRT